MWIEVLKNSFQDNRIIFKIILKVKIKIKTISSQESSLNLKSLEREKDNLLLAVENLIRYKIPMNSLKFLWTPLNKTSNKTTFRDKITISIPLRIPINKKNKDNRGKEMKTIQILPLLTKDNNSTRAIPLKEMSLTLITNHLFIPHHSNKITPKLHHHISNRLRLEGMDSLPILIKHCQINPHLTPL